MSAEKKDRAPKGGPVPWETEWGHGDSEGDSTTPLAYGEQPSLDDALEQARQARDAGADTALNAAHSWVRLHLEEHLDQLIRSGREFTAEDLRARAGTPLASSPNTLGSVILAASKQGRIECTGYCESTRPEARCRVLRVWRGTGNG